MGGEIRNQVGRKGKKRNFFLKKGKGELRKERKEGVMENG